MMKRIFLENPLQLTFDAHVLSAEKAGEKWEVRLDRTAFYPEGGGQPADQGRLGGIPVIDVQEREGEIIHILTDPPPGGSIQGVVDGIRRRDYMQQHTGQHIISAAFWKTSRLATVSVHMGAEVTTIDLDTPDLAQSQLESALDLANRVIAEDRALEAVEATPDELPAYSLRKPAPVDGPVRLVRIRDFDCVGCCGLHLPSTGPVRLCVCTGLERIRGMARTIWKIGDRAVQDLRSRVKIMSELRAELGTSDRELVETVTRLARESSELRADIGHLEGRLASMLADSLPRGGEQATTGGATIITHILDNERPNIVKATIKTLLARENTAFVIINTQPEGMNWSVGVPESMPLDFNVIRKEVLKGFNARGGGRPPLWQGSAPDPARAVDLLKNLKKALQSGLESTVPSGA